MYHYISPETKEKIRELVKSGKKRYDVAKELGINPATVFRLTVDLQKNPNRLRKLTIGDIEKLRTLVAGGMSKYDASKEVGISYTYATILTRDFSSARGNRNLGESSARVLQKMLKDGYFIPHERSMTTRHRVLHQYFPILKVQVSNKTIYYLEDRKEEAFKGFLRDIGSKVVTYNKLRETARLFGVPLDAKMKVELLGKNGENKPNIMKLSYRAKVARRRLNQQNSEFIGSFTHSELLGNKALHF